MDHPLINYAHLIRQPKLRNNQKNSTLTFDPYRSKDRARKYKGKTFKFKLNCISLYMLYVTSARDVLIISGVCPTNQTEIPGIAMSTL